MNDQLKLVNIQTQNGLLDLLLSHFRKHVETIDQKLNENSVFLDKSIITISSGAIGIFFTFNNELLQQNINCYPKTLLIISVLFFTFAISAVLGSYYTLRKSLIQQGKNINDWYNKRREAIYRIDITKSVLEQQNIITEVSVEPVFDNIWSNRTDKLNFLAASFLFLGILNGVLFFILSNI